MAVRIGVNPIGWTNDDLETLGDDAPLEACLAEARQAGYAGSSSAGSSRGGRRSSGPCCSSTGSTSCRAGTAPAPPARRRRRRSPRCRPTRAPGRAGLDGHGVRRGDGSVHGRLGVPCPRGRGCPRPDWPRFGEALTQVAERPRPRGMRLAYHHHMGTVVETEAEIDRLMAATGAAVGLLLDTGHLTYAGGDVLAVARRHAGRIVHVHCKDVRPAVLAAARRRDRSFLDAVVDGVFTVPGDGCVDYRALLGPARARATRAGSSSRRSRTRSRPSRSPTREWVRPPEPAARRARTVARPRGVPRSIACSTGPVCAGGLDG